MTSNINFYDERNLSDRFVLRNISESEEPFYPQERHYKTTDRFFTDIREIREEVKQNSKRIELLDRLTKEADRKDRERDFENQERQRDYQERYGALFKFVNSFESRIVRIEKILGIRSGIDYGKFSDKPNEYFGYRNYQSYPWLEHESQFSNFGKNPSFSFRQSSEYGANRQFGVNSPREIRRLSSSSRSSREEHLPRYYSFFELPAYQRESYQVARNYSNSAYNNFDRLKLSNLSNKGDYLYGKFFK